jgi:hypothetical protein
MLTNSDLFDILMMRSTQPYHDAEVLRRLMGGSAPMALSPPGSEAHAAVRLLIGTWENIANRVRAGGPLTTQFYKDNPVGHMWYALWPGIKILRGKGFKNKNVGAFYAREFQQLNIRYKTWLITQPASYRTAALEGINAQFG